MSLRCCSILLLHVTCCSICKYVTYQFWTQASIVTKLSPNVFKFVDVDHVINRKMMKSVRRWMNRNFVFFENFGFTLFGYRWFASRLQFDFQKLYKNFKIFQFFLQKPQFHARAHHHQNIFHHPLLYHFPPPLNFHGQNLAMALESWKIENVGDDQLMTVIQWF